LFGFVAFAAASVVVMIGDFAPHTRGLSLEAITH
jgi:hypothetical protein